MLLTATGSTCAYLWLFAAVLSLGGAEGVPNNPEISDIVRLRQTSPAAGSTGCLVPPQPTNGRWKLHKRFCDDDQDCAIPQRVMLPSGSQLVYRCDPGYRIEENVDVFCTATGIWSAVPTCVQITCSSLSTASRRMAHAGSPSGELFGDSPVDTPVRLICRPQYTKDRHRFPGTIGEMVFCSAEGKWEPVPMECLPVCGVRTFWEEGSVHSSIIRYTRNKDSPWHASLYLSNGPRKNFICGATIVRPKLLLTAAVCVRNGKTKSSVDPRKLFVMTGNIFVDYDSPLHDPDVVKKAAVKKIYSVDRSSKYFENIAMLELQEPFALSYTLRPACMDLNKDEKVKLEPGEYGILVGLGGSSSNGSGDFLQNITVPYVSDLQDEKFVAGPTNGSGICGSGIVFERETLWYVLGVLKSCDKFGENSEKTCNRSSASCFEWIFPYGDRIETLITTVELEELSRPPIRTTTANPLTTPTTNSSTYEISSSAEDSFCLVPPQPENGKWRAHGYLCENNTECDIPQGTRLKPGSALTYSCARGYRASGNNKAFCGLDGNWVDIPDCVEVRCDPLNSVSVTASCSHFGREVSCDYSVPSGTRAEITCSKGYEKDTVFIPTRRDTLTCTKNGVWQPEPIRCIPVCGVPITHQTPLAVGGTAAAIGDFPWHATLYRQIRSSKEFICGATIVHRKLLLTAAHCVYEENDKTTVDPGILFVLTGNIFRNYDSLAHDPQTVRKGEVKNVHVHMNYFGLEGNYASDIALLELQKPFDISETLLPACLDIDGRSERILHPGAYGKVAGFGRTESAVASSNLQTVTLPFVSYSQCKNSSDDNQIKKLINDGKFCAGYTNGTSVCDGDSGGGLVFETNKVWYVLGIVSVGLGADFSGGAKMCNPYSYTAFTKVSMYINWIQDIIVNLEQ